MEYHLAWYCPNEPDILAWQDRTDEDLAEYSGLVDYIQDYAEEITPEEFFEVIDEETVLNDLMYGSVYDKYFKIEDDDYISWYKSYYPDGTIIYFHTQSGIEHVYEPVKYDPPY